MSIEQLMVSVDCEIYSSDGLYDEAWYSPLYVYFEARYDNSQGTVTGNVEITDARVALGSESLKPVWYFDVDPSTSGAIPAGVSAKVVHLGIAGSGQMDPPEVEACMYCYQPAQLELDVLIDGTPAYLTAETPAVECYTLDSSS